MTENTNDSAVTYEKGSWGEMLQQSTTLKERAGKATKRAGEMLWNGAQAAIEDWNSDTDPSGEELYELVKAALGNARRGDAKKIKDVALAVVNHGLVMSVYPNLSKAYAEARRLTSEAPAQKQDDETADEVLSSITAPKTATTIEAAAKVLLAKGSDGAVVALFDAITEAAKDGDAAEAAIRSFLRAATSEATARVKHRADEAKAAEAEAKAKEREAKAVEREKARAERAAAKPKAKKATAKPKPKAAAKPKPKADAAEDEAPAKATAKPKPVRRPKPVARPKKG